jgi:hypothetical protein
MIVHKMSRIERDGSLNAMLKTSWHGRDVPHMQVARLTIRRRMHTVHQTFDEAG